MKPRSASCLTRRVFLYVSLWAILAQPVAADQLAYEPFADYEFDKNMAQQSPPLPAGTGITAWSSNNTFVVNHARTESLVYGSLETTGGKMEFSGGGIVMNATLDTSGAGPFAGLVSGGEVGNVSSGDLYCSLLFRIGDLDSNVASFVTFAGSNDFALGRNWGTGQFWAQTSLGTNLDENTHLFVIRFRFQSGSDEVTVWLDPDLSLAQGQQTVDASLVREVRFDSLEIVSHWNAAQSTVSPAFLDEIRFGTTWEDVVPTVSTYTLDATAEANGSVYASPQQDEYTDGTEVYLEANGDFGYRFASWTGDVPAGSQTTNPLTLVMDRNRTISAVFEPGVPEFFVFDPGPDPYGDDSVFDLRRMNEAVAGMNGFVTRQGDQFLLGDGTPVRFWAATVDALDEPEMSEMARFLGKRGINLVRWHTSLYNNGATNMASVNGSAIEDAQRMVVAMKEQGIYTKLSYFFILGLRMQPEWGIEGYTQDWIDTHPAETGAAPFGLQFFDEDFKDAMKAWLSELLTRPNPYDDDQTPLKDEPAVAIIEIQNEDNLFFWTFDPTRWPLVQQQKVDQAFGDFLIDQYGSINAAISAWGGAGSGGLQGRDVPASGRMTVNDAYFMTRNTATSGASGNRMADQIAFLTQVQHDFYAEFTDYLENTLGVRCTISASNWHTAADEFLYDLEHYTYTAAGVVDVHNYFGPLIVNQALFTNIQGGDTFFTVPGINNPRRLPAIYKQVTDHPNIISESTWNNPTWAKPEAALLIAAYGSLVDLDAFHWFATGSTSWQPGNRTWEFMSPALGGMFPGAAMLYRRGDVTPAPVVVREARPLDEIYDKTEAQIQQTVGWDPTRDPDGEFTFDPEDGTGQIDSLAMLVGKVEVAFSGNTYVDPDLDNYIDNDARRVTSRTGELELYWGQVKGEGTSNPTDGEGWFRVDSPRSQGVAGFLGAAGAMSLSNIDIEMENEFGTVLAVSLDGLPLSRSREILIQAAAREHLRGYEETTVPLSSGGAIYQGAEIVNLGSLPWQMEGIRCTVTLKGTGSIESIQAVDGNGYPIADLGAGSVGDTGTTFDLPGQALYTYVKLKDPSRYGEWSAFTTAEWMDESISGRTRDPDGDGVPNFAEYMLRGDPKSSDAAGVLQGRVVEATPDDRFELDFDIRTDDPGTAWRVEVSADLTTWHHNGDGSGHTWVETLSSTPYGDGTSAMTVQLHPQTDGVEKLFVRVVVE